MINHLSENYLGEEEPNTYQNNAKVLGGKRKKIKLYMCTSIFLGNLPFMKSVNTMQTFHAQYDPIVLVRYK